MGDRIAGLVARLFARTWPDEVDGLVMVDTMSPLIREVASAEAVAKWDAFNGRSVPEAPEAVMLLDAFAKIDAAAPLRDLPAVVLSSAKPWRPPSAEPESDPAAGVTFGDWQASERLLATSLTARLVTDTHSGHNIYAYAPELVIDAIREVVDAARAVEAAANGTHDTATASIAPDVRTVFAGLVAIGDDREIYLECRGTGVPTVVLISGGWEPGWIWTHALVPGDPVHSLPYDFVSVGGGAPAKLDTAVFPAVSTFTRVCLYDRPNTTVEEDVQLKRGGLVWSPVPQPHALGDDVADLHACSPRPPGPVRSCSPRIPTAA